MSQELPPLEELEPLLPPLLQLPVEILSNIISFINRDPSLPCVSRYFRQLAQSEYIPNARDLLQALKNKI